MGLDNSLVLNRQQAIARPNIDPVHATMHQIHITLSCSCFGNYDSDVWYQMQMIQTE